MVSKSLPRQADLSHIRTRFLVSDISVGEREDIHSVWVAHYE